MDNIIQKTRKFLIDLLFPKFCLGCQKEGSYLCDDCRALLDICEFDYCLCGANEMPKPARVLQGSDSGKCQKCQEKKLSGLYFAIPYKDGVLIKKLIYQFKYQPYLKDLSETLASLLAEHFIKTGKNTEKIWAESILVPVPLDRKKLKTRGYNQSEELAKKFSEIVKVPVVSGCLVKIKETKPQAESKKEERENNLLGAFAISAPTGRDLASGGKNPIAGKKVFLVDDVYTTGSTMEECARVLRDAGAKQIWGIAIAREG